VGAVDGVLRRVRLGGRRADPAQIRTSRNRTSLELVTGLGRQVDPGPEEHGPAGAVPTAGDHPPVRSRHNLHRVRAGTGRYRRRHRGLLPLPGPASRGRGYESPADGVVCCACGWICPTYGLRWPSCPGRARPGRGRPPKPPGLAPAVTYWLFHGLLRGRHANGSPRHSNSTRRADRHPVQGIGPRPPLSSLLQGDTDAALPLRDEGNALAVPA